MYGMLRPAGGTAGVVVVVSSIRARPSPGHYARIGTIVAGMLGALAGLVVGLIVHPATAWAAMFELGIPAGVVGGLLGLLVGFVVALGRRLRSH